MSVTAVLPLVLVRALVLASLATILVRPIAGVPTTNRALQQPQYAGFDRNDDVDEQRDFLEALYDSTNGGAWIRRNDWKDATVSYCNWEGVSCRGYLGLNNIHELELGSNNLVGMLPNEKIGSLVEIETLDLANNDLTGPLPEELGDLRRLNYMFIEGNEFDTPLPGIVCIKFQPGKYGFEERNEFMNDLEVCTGGFWSSKSSIKVLRIQCIIWISILSIGCLGMFRIQLAQFCGKRTALLQRQIIRHEDPESQSGGLKIQLVWSLLWGVYFFREEQLDIARLILIALLVMIFVFSTKDMYWFKQMVKYVRGGDEDSNRQPTNNQSTTAGEDYNVAEDPSRTVDEDSNVAEDQGTTVGEDSNVAEDQSTTVGEDSNVAEVQSKPSELVRHFPKLSICMLVVQISIAIVGFFVLGFSQSDAYGATLAASGILGWNFSILSWIFTLPSGPKVVEDGGPKITSANAGTSWNPLKRVWSSFGGHRQCPFLVSTLILPLSCFLGLQNNTQETMFLILTTTTNIAWMIPFRLVMDALRKVINMDNGSANGASDTVIISMVTRFFIASIPLFYVAMNSISSFIKYSTADDIDDANDDLAAALSNYFLGISSILTILAIEVWYKCLISWKGLITLSVTKMEAASFVLSLLIIFTALVLESQVIPFTINSMPYFFVAMTNTPPLLLGVLYFMCRSLWVKDGNKHFLDRKQAVNNNPVLNALINDDHLRRELESRFG